MKRGMFRKLLAGSFLVIGLTLAGLDVYLTRYTAAHQVREVERRLALTARLLSGEVPSVPRAGLEEWARQAGARAEARITVIDRGGGVLADSHHDPETMESHANRPEVREAIGGRAGSAVRRSATLKQDFSYVAVPIEAAGNAAVLRAAVPLAEVDALIAGVRRRILESTAVAALAALLIAYIFSRRLARRVGRLKKFAAGFLNREIAGDLPAAGDDELESLELSFTQMAGRIHSLVDQLQLESARLQTILGTMSEGVLAADERLNVNFCNEAFARATGASFPLPQGTPLSEVVLDEQMREVLAGALASGQTRRERLQMDGEPRRSFEVLAAPLEAGPRRGILAVLHDITDLERLERVRKDFVANVSHELRTPLTAIRGYAETLLDGALDDSENNRRFVEVIRAHAIRLNNIASDLLVLSELESGRPAAEPERVPVRAAVETALSTVTSEAKVRDVRIAIGTLQDCEVLGQRIRLEQTLVNLLDNAVKFNRPGGEVRLSVERDPEGRVRITIADTGVGISQQDLSRIFERFYRVDKARSRQVGGTGLGLSIVKHVVEGMGGTIDVQSVPGEGSTFTVSLPLAVA